ncbi:hypothetical protein [Gracilimonas sp.]|uniref:hypothetical protein n=1 Tax=Gracilimonas sp. TaxID=1974203 RepID=UPI003750F217
MVVCTLLLTLTIEFAIVLSEDKTESKNLTIFTIRVTFLTSIFLLGLSYFSANSLSALFNIPPLGDYTDTNRSPGQCLFQHRESGAYK